jgi:hypothetical protein
MPPFLILTLILLSVAGTAVLIVSLWRRPPLSADAVWLTKAQLGQFEERLAGLREVIFFGDRIEVPTRQNAHDILIALIDNFAEGVQYHFVVPAEYAVSHRRTVTERYGAIVRLSEQLAERPLPADIFQIRTRPLPPGLTDFPYLFYRFDDGKGGDEIVAFRGEDRGVGIAAFYRRLEPEVARSFLLTALSLTAGEKALLAPVNHYDVFSEAGKIIPMTRGNRHARQLA